MSFRNLPIKLSLAAKQDFIDILRYTGEKWGHAQLEAYRGKIDDALQTIGRNPFLGHNRDDLPSPLRVYLVGAHVIVYRISDSEIGILRLLHQRMSLSLHVPED